MKCYSLILIASNLLVCAELGLTQPMQTNLFNNGDEGWSVVNWDGLGDPVVPSWHAEGGNSGGYIRGLDWHGDGFWHAPASCLGDWSGAYGSILRYDAFTLVTGWKMNDLYITSHDQTLAFWFPDNPGTTWTSFAVALDSAAGWQYGLNYDTIGTPATEMQIRSVLANVTDVRIREEYAYGPDDSGLDNVVLPIPAALLYPVFDAAVLGSGKLQLTLRRLQPNAWYQLEQARTLNQVEPWGLVTTFQATDSWKTLTVAPTNSFMFFRVRCQ